MKACIAYGWVRLVLYQRIYNALEGTVETELFLVACGIMERDTMDIICWKVTGQVTGEWEMQLKDRSIRRNGKGRCIWGNTQG